MTPQALLAAAQQIADRWPGAVLERNAVGNLVVMDDDVAVAWLDVMDGEVSVF